jgi:hypothetical protein
MIPVTVRVRFMGPRCILFWNFIVLIIKFKGVYTIKEMSVVMGFKSPVSLESKTTEMHLFSG